MILYETHIPDKERPVVDAVLSRYFADEGPVVADIRTEGQKILEDGTISLGLRAGPGISIWNLFHEMCHFVEIDDARVNQPGWGLRNGKFCSLGSSIWYEQLTSKSIRRELRVGAYQYHRGAAFDFYDDAADFSRYYAGVCRFLPIDALCTLAREEDCYKGEGERRCVDYEAACEKVLLQLIADPSYHLEAFEAEWSRKTKMLATGGDN